MGDIFTDFLEDFLDRRVFLPLQRGLGGVSYLAVDAGKGAGFERDDIDAERKTKPPRWNRPKNVFHCRLRKKYIRVTVYNQ